MADGYESSLERGTISFGLVSIPVSLLPATRREELKFHLLRSSDLSPINYKRVAEANGKEVPWEQIVKGYEYEKGKFVVLKEEDFARVDVEATQTVDIVNLLISMMSIRCFFTNPTISKWGKAETKPMYFCGMPWSNPEKLRSPQS